MAAKQTAPSIRDRIGRRLIQIRLAFGESQSQFARRLGDPGLQKRLSDYESGKTGPTVDFLDRVSAIGVNVHWLICGTGKVWARKPRGVQL